MAQFSFKAMAQFRIDKCKDNITITERYHFDENLILTKIIREEKLIDEINGSRFTMKTLEKSEKENIEIPTDYTTELMLNPLYGINL